MNAHRQSHILVGGVALLLMACSGADESTHGFPPESAPTVRFTITPEDMVSAAADTPIGAWLDYGDRIVPKPAVDAVAASISLETYPGATTVPFSVVVQPSTHPSPSAPASPNPWHAFVGVVPSAELLDGWYRVSLDASAAGVVPEFSGMYPASIDGRYGSRFSLLRAPTLKSVTSCFGSSVRKIVVSFSEPVSANAEADLAIVDDIGCNWSEAGAGSFRATYGFACSVSPALAELHLHLGPLVAVDGQVATVLDASAPGQPFKQAPLVQTVDFTDAIDAEPGCKTWIP